MATFNLRRLEIFRAVYMAGSVSGAARQLGVSQPSVSRHLKYYEQQIGLPLFDLVKGRLQPTREADQLFSATAGVFEEVDHVSSVVEQLRRGDGQSIRVMSSGIFLSTVLPAVTGALSQSWPGLRFEFQVGSGAAQIRALRRGIVDISLNSAGEPVPGIHRESVGRAQMVVMMHRDHPLAATDVITLRELSKWPCVGGFATGSMGSLIGPHLEAAGVELSYHVIAGFNYMVPNMIEGTRGIGLVGNLSASSHRSEMTIVRPLNIDLEYDFYVLSTENSLTGKLQQEFVDLARAEISRRTVAY